ncbi:MAG TPA: c-type cytochrome, methanol metabolism-related [Roseiarcus sp.]|nr:c-type cytochrome, methanol metabolism-related [Roseiarcus sp.]
MRIVHPLIGAAFILGLAAPIVARADAPGDPTAVKQDDNGMWVDKDGDPTYKIEKDGTVDWYTNSGFVRYTANCLVCHGPDGDGSSFGPALKDSLKTMPYAEFYGIVVSGRKDFRNGQDLVMPSWGENKNVMCYLNDIYVYLRARSTGAQPRGRPEKHAPKPAAWTKNEDKCMGPD